MPMAVPTRVEDVMAFLTDRGFSASAAALQDDLLSLAPAPAPDDLDLDVASSLPPLKLLPPIRGGGGGDGAASPSRSPAPAPASSSSSSSTDAFVSMGSSPSELLNPYGVWSPARAKSEASSSARYSEFGTAREYSYWYDELFAAGNQNDHYSVETNSNFGRYHSDDKFIMSADDTERTGGQESFHFGVTNYKNEHGADAACEGCTEVYSCPFPLCDCCRGRKVQNSAQVSDTARSSSSAVHGRYQIFDDHTERLDGCGENDFPFKIINHQIEGVGFEGDSLHQRKESLVSGLVEKELKMLKPCALDTNACADLPFACKRDCNRDLCSGEMSSVNHMSPDDPENDEHNIDNFSENTSEEAAAASEFGGLLTDVKGVENSVIDGFKGVADKPDELQFYNSIEDELEVFNLRIIHHKNRTGFEENKDFPIVLNSVIAGRYYITEYLGSAAFSKVVQAHDLHTGIDVCLKMIKNNKDFFDQSLDEIKLLKLVNKYDPADQNHLLRLYDYFYHQEHLFIVTELLRANLYEFQKYNRESGGEDYYTFPRIQAIARQCLEALEYLHYLRIIHCDLKPENILIKSYSRCEIKVIDLGSSCFETDNLSSYVQSRSYRAPEVILGLPYDQKIDIWSLGCVLAELYTGDVLFPNDSVQMILACMIGILGPIDMEMLELGQETNKYFTSSYELYYTNEETGQTEYLIPEKSSLSQHLQGADANFIDFLSCLLQTNPGRRPTATEALQHQWLSFVDRCT